MSLSQILKVPGGSLYSIVVVRQSCKLKVAGSIPAGGIAVVFYLLF